MEVLNCMIKIANKFSLVGLSHSYLQVSYELKQAAIMDVKIWINKAYHSLLKSHLAAQICTVSYAEYFMNSSENRFGGALLSKMGQL